MWEKGAKQAVGAKREAKLLNCLLIGMALPFATTEQSASIAHSWREEHFGDGSSIVLDAVKKYDHKRHFGKC